MRARFGHRREISLQVHKNQQVKWWAERDSNFLPSSLFSKLLNSSGARHAQLARYATRRHKLGTAFYRRGPLRRHPLPPSKFSTAPCSYLDPDQRLPLRHLVNMGVLRHQEFFLPTAETFVTVLVHRAVTIFVFLCQPLSLRKLCVAHSRAKGAFNENSSGFVLRLCSFQPTRVYACCHAQPCAGSRAVWAAWCSTAMSSALWSQRFGQARPSSKVDPLQGASVWGRLA